MLERLKMLYYLKIKKMNVSDYNKMLLIKRGGVVGKGVWLFQDIRTTESCLISIGDNTTIASGAVFCTHDNAISKVLPESSDLVGKISIGNNCFVGTRSIIMYGVSIGNSCIIGAGSVVTSSFPDNCVIAGNPGRFICTAQEYAEKHSTHAVNFDVIPKSERNLYIMTHPEIIEVKPLKAYAE